MLFRTVFGRLLRYCAFFARNTYSFHNSCVTLTICCICRPFLCKFFTLFCLCSRMFDGPCILSTDREKKKKRKTRTVIIRITVVVPAFAFAIRIYCSTKRLTVTDTNWLPPNWFHNASQYNCTLYTALLRNSDFLRPERVVSCLSARFKCSFTSLYCQNRHFCFSFFRSVDFFCPDLVKIRKNQRH